MKKMLSFIIGIILLSQIIVSPQIYANYLDSQGMQESNKFDSIEENIRYFDISPRVDYQLSQEQLNLPTDELVDLILDYPYLVDFFCISTPELVYSNLKNSFNGFSELEKRSDATTVLLAKYLNKDNSASENDLCDFYINKILSVPIYFENLSENELDYYLCATNTDGFAVNSLASEPDISPLQTIETDSSTYVEFTVNGFSYVRSSTNGFTTSGTVVPLYSALTDYSSADQSYIAESTAQTYNIECLGNATSMYNCHSYAWHLMSTTNNAWIADISPYVYDAHCEILEQDDIVEVGTIVIYLDAYNQPLHSAVVSEIDDDNIICKSKWGANGLFEHHIASVPSAYTSDGSTIIVVFCNYTRTHNYSIAQNDTDTDTHTKTCTICGYLHLEGHVYEYEPLNDTYHILMCECGKTSGTQSLHTLKISGGFGNYRQCTACGILVYTGGTGIYPVEPYNNSLVEECFLH